MLTVNKPAMTASEYADRICFGCNLGSAAFQDKKMRDAVAKLLVSWGRKVRKSSIRNQRLHPMYVVDYVGTYQTGFGNADYQTFFKVLYMLDVAR